MNFCARRFNLYLLLLLMTAAICGCGTTKKKEPEKISAVRIHVEAPVSVPGKTRTINVLRSNPVIVTVDAEPILSEQNLIGAEVIDTPGGFAIRLQFEETAGWILEEATAGNPGKHLVIFGQWGEKVSEGRFLAVPLITERNATATLTFTPDASREEMDRFVEGLDNVIKLVHAKKK